MKQVVGVIVIVGALVIGAFGVQHISTPKDSAGGVTTNAYDPGRGGGGG